MPDIRTDDTPRRLRAVWLGPRGKTLSWEWTYVQWLLAIGIGVAASTVLLLVLYPVDPVIGVTLGLGGGAVLGVKLAGAIVERTSYDQPVRFWRRTLIGEFRRSHRAPRESTVRVEAPTTRGLATWARRETQ